MGLRTAAGCGVECQPAFTGNVSFDPGVSIAGADNVLRGNVIELATGKPVDHARGNSSDAKHDGHCGRKIFAVSAATDEQKVRYRVRWLGVGELQGVSVVRSEVSFDRRSAVVRSLCIGDN